MLRRKLSPRSFLSAALVALPVLFVATEASAQECVGDADCGHGFSCETIITSVGSGIGGAAGTSGAGDTAGGAAGFATGGTGVGGSTSYGGSPTGGSAGTGSPTGGIAGTGGTGVGGSFTGGSAGTTGVPVPPVCNNAICQAGETPANCPNDCKYTTICATAPCTSDSDCAADFYCPPVGSVGTGGGPNVSFCGDLLCTAGTEDQFTCPIDCDPNYRRCTLGLRGCRTNADCGVGYVCTFSGGAGGSGGTAGTGASGAPAGGQSSEAAPATGGTGAGGIGGTSGTGFGGGAGTGVAGSGSAGVPNGGSSGIPAEGVCSAQGTGGTSACPYCCPPGQIWTGDFCATDGQPPSGGTTGNGGTGQNGGTGGDRNSGDEGDTIVTHGGCALSRPNASSPFALLLVAFVALLRFGRRRSN